jgi:glycerol-3-phosphate O-acyltransferase
VRQVIAPLLDHLDERDVPGPAQDLRDAAAVESTLKTLVDGGVVSAYAAGSEPVWSIAADHHHVAAFYRNGMLHHVLNRAIVELTVLDLAERRPEGDAAENAWEEALRYRDLLKFEFFFKRKSRYMEEITEEAERLGWDGRRDVSGAVELVSGAPVLVANGVLRSFVDAQYVVASRLVEQAPDDEDAFLNECLAYGRQLLLQGRIQGADSISRELFANALKLAANRGGDAQAWLDELVATRALLDRIAQLDAARLEEVLDGHAG